MITTDKIEEIKVSLCNLFEGCKYCPFDEEKKRTCFIGRASFYELIESELVAGIYESLKEQGFII
jgi:hypothetical protein